MKTRYILLMIIIIAGIADMAYSQSSNQNYIHTRTYTNESGTVYLDQIQYFDGLGRPMQMVQKAIIPGTDPSVRKDLVSLQEYDGFGRKGNVWIPAAISVNNGAYVTPATIKNNAVGSNAGDQKTYSYHIYETSPLNRTTHQYGSGADWQSNGKAVKVESLTNRQNDPALRCRTFGEEARYITPEGGGELLRMGSWI